LLPFFRHISSSIRQRTGPGTALSSFLMAATKGENHAQVRIVSRMTSSIKYGEVALGVECALPWLGRAPRRHNHARLFIGWLIAALGRWA
jgi:hypothetical protein